MIEISIFEDNGIGFDEKIYRQILIFFFSVWKEKIRKAAELVLQFCRKIALRHRGNIIAKSKKVSGSTFIVSILRLNKT